MTWDMLNNERDLGTVAAGGNQTAVWGSGDDKLTVRDDVTGKSYKLVFEITYNDGEKVYQTEKYVFVKTIAKEKPADQGGQGSQGGQNTEPQTPQGGQQDNSGGGVDTGDSGELPETWAEAWYTTASR